jgi:zinc protease
MKLKITIFLAAILMISANVFGQKTETKPVVKIPEIKPSTTEKLPTVKEILDKYVQALGGRAANEKIKTRVMKGTVDLAPMGIKGTAESYQSAPDKSYNKISLGGIGDIIEAFDGTKAWTINPIQGNRDKTGDELLQSKIAANFHRELNFETLYPKTEVKGIEKIGDKDAYVVVATPAGLDSQTFYFDKQTGLLLREDATAISPEGKMPVKSFYEDYREIDGVKLPYKMRLVLPQFEITTIMTEVKNDVKVEDSLFAKPKE